MKNITLSKKGIFSLILWWGTITPVWAAGSREDNSDLFVWIFLAFCALIIVAQLIPAMMVLFGFAKGIKKEAPLTAEETINALPAQDRQDA